MLSFSRASSIKAPFQKIELFKIITEIVEDLEIRIKSTKAKVEIKNLPILDADPVQVRQLFHNLITNCLKFQKEGVAPIIKISSILLPRVDSIQGSFCENRWQVVVEDNGIGFENQFKERIFKVFHRFDTKRPERNSIAPLVCQVNNLETAPKCLLALGDFSWTSLTSYRFMTTP